MINRRTVVGAMMLLWVLGPVLNVVFAAQQTPRATVESFHATLLVAMQNAVELAFTGRRDLMAPSVSESFDLSFISEVVAGRYWKTWDAVQRERMLAMFSKLTVATYAARFHGYSGQQFKVTDTRPLKKERVLVRSVLVGIDGDEVQLDYVLHQRDDGWKVINVVAEGVSDLSVKRADYARVLSTAGFEQLMNRLEEKVRLLSGAA